MLNNRVLFENRQQAGRQLAGALTGSHYDPVRFDLVLALPRGGVPVAYEVATRLQLPLDVMVVRKLGAPGQEEFGIGAVVDSDPPQVVMNPQMLEIVQPSERYIEAEIQRQRREIARRRQAYIGKRPPINVSGRRVLLVDDGIATGGTAKAAARALRQAGAATVTLAVPVAPRSTLDELASEVEDMVCLATPDPFSAVGRHYQDFTQTSDDEVIALLQAARDAQGE
ncbi:phosphoribosyltransferase [Vreelandella arcis]|uniref:Putative phosphoribosyl transferase n=1 Tax=Vreelandella arcis TaxID=416873 RepID=A0A1H0HB46_9GAMM|nr:phosphoribosyltransferase family protein [Halomonas arcis]SDO16372.1 putative phosphoribosyl transferase [Halomonas arcis]